MPTTLEAPRYTLLRAKFIARDEPIGVGEVQTELSPAAEADAVASEIDGTRLQIATIRAAATDVLAAQTTLRLATARLEAALRDHREASAVSSAPRCLRRNS